MQFDVDLQQVRARPAALSQEVVETFDRHGRRGRGAFAQHPRLKRRGIDVFVVGVVEHDLAGVVGERQLRQLDAVAVEGGVLGQATEDPFHRLDGQDARVRGRHGLGHEGVDAGVGADVDDEARVCRELGPQPAAPGLERIAPAMPVDGVLDLDAAVTDAKGATFAQRFGEDAVEGEMAPDRGRQAVAERVEQAGAIGGAERGGFQL